MRIQNHTYRRPVIRAIPHVARFTGWLILGLISSSVASVRPALASPAFEALIFNGDIFANPSLNGQFISAWGLPPDGPLVFGGQIFGDGIVLSTQGHGRVGSGELPTLIAKERDVLPDGSRVGEIEGAPVFAGGGHMAFFTEDFSLSDDQVFTVTPDNAVTELVSVGDTLTNGWTLDRFQDRRNTRDWLQINRNGQTAVTARLSVPNQPLEFPFGLLTFTPDGQPDMQILPGQPVAGGGTLLEPGNPWGMSDDGAVATIGTLRNDDESVQSFLFVADPVAGILPVVREEEFIASIGRYFYWLQPPRMSGNGQVAFSARALDAQGNQADGIFRYDPINHNLVVIADSNDAIPDRPGDTFRNFDSDVWINDAGLVMFGRYSQLYLSDGSEPLLTVIPADFRTDEGYYIGQIFVADLNESGQVAFSAALRDENDDYVGPGIFFYDPQLGLTKVIGTGDGLFDATLTFSSRFPTGFSGSSLVGDMLNEQGQVAFNFDLNNGRSGIALWSSQIAFRLGDYNDNGRVEQGDLDLVLNNWGQTRGDWANAEGFASEGVDQEELDRVLNHWGSSSAPSLNGVDVPEPAVGLALVGLLLGVSRRHCA